MSLVNKEEQKLFEKIISIHGGNNKNYLETLSLHEQRKIMAAYLFSDQTDFDIAPFLKGNQKRENSRLDVKKSKISNLHASIFGEWQQDEFSRQINRSVESIPEQEDDGQDISLTEMKLFLILAERYSQKKRDTYQMYLKLPILEKKRVLRMFYKEMDENEAKFERVKSKLPFDRSYSTFAINFDSIFENETIKVGFFQHLIRESNTEPFEFLLEVRSLPDDKSHQTIDKFFGLVAKYITTNAPKELNISGVDKSNLLKKIGGQSREKWTLLETPLEVLQEIIRSVRIDLQVESFSRFKASEEGFKLFVLCADDENVISKEKSQCVLYKLQKMTIPSEQLDFLKNLYSNIGLMTTFLWEKFENVSQDVTSMVVFVNKLSRHHGLVGDLFKSDKKISTGLIIGSSWIFEWGEGDLCIPSAIDSSSYYIGVPCDTFNVNDMRNLCGKIAKFVCESNAKRERNPKIPKFNDGMNFIHDLMKSCDFKSSLEDLGLMKLYKQIQSSGNTPMSEISLEGGIKKQFGSHEEFDDFFNGFLTTNEDVKKRRGESNFLLSIDTAFWLRKVALESDVEIFQTQLDQCNLQLMELVKRQDFGILYGSLREHIKNLQNSIKNSQTEIKLCFSAKCPCQRVDHIKISTCKSKETE